jgi:hypothetical protein
MTYLIIIVSFCEAFIEGYREYIVYEIDKAGRFPKRNLAVFRKGINAFLYIAFMSLLIIFSWPTSWGFVNLLLLTLFMRWLVLDGTLNVLREKAFFYIGSVSTIDKIISHFPWAVPFVKIGGLLLTTYFALC